MATMLDSIHLEHSPLPWTPSLLLPVLPLLPPPPPIKAVSAKPADAVSIECECRITSLGVSNTTIHVWNTMIPARTQGVEYNDICVLARESSTQTPSRAHTTAPSRRRGRVLKASRDLCGGCWM